MNSYCDYEKLKIAHELIKKYVKKENERLPSNMSCSICLAVGFNKKGTYFSFHHKGIWYHDDIDTLIEEIRRILK